MYYYGQVGRVTDPNRSGIFNDHNRNKPAADRREHHRQRELPPWRDGALGGLTHDELIRIKLDIIFARLSGLGHSGPESPYGTAGPVVQALCGLTQMAGLPDREPSGWGYSYWLLTCPLTSH